MPELASYSYARVHVVPRVERLEALSIGVILFCRTRRYLAARIEVDPVRLALFSPALDLEALEQYVATIPRLCAGGGEAGPIGALTLTERFHWLVAPRSTIVQTSPVHGGLCLDPAITLDRLMRDLIG